MVKKQWGIRINEKVLKDYDNFCSRNGLKVAHHLEIALKRYMDFYEGNIKSNQEQNKKKRIKVKTDKVNYD